LISVCAGLVVTRVASAERRTSSTSADVLRQISSDPRVLTMAACVLVVLALIPGLPFIPFFVVAIALLVLAGSVFRSFDLRQRALAQSSGMRVVGVDGERSRLAISHQSGSVSTTVAELKLLLDVETLGKYFENEQNRQNFNDEYTALSDRYQRERGISLPRCVLELEPRYTAGQYSVLVREQTVRNGAIDLERVFVPIGQSAVRVFGIDDVVEARHPLLASAASWLKRSAGEGRGLERLGAKLYTPAQFLALEAVAGVVDAVDELVGVDEVKRDVEALRVQYRGLVDEVIAGGMISYSELADLMRRLVRDRIPVRDFKLILEGVAEYAATHGPFEHRQQFLDGAHPFLRRILGRAVLQGAIGPSGVLRAFTLGADVEDRLRESSQTQPNFRSGLTIDPALQLALRDAGGALFGPVIDRGALPVVILCSADIRLLVDEFFSKQLPTREWYRTIAYDELDSRIALETVGVLDCEPLAV